MNTNFNEAINERKLLSPKLDVIFQALFGEIGNEKITKGFIEAILDRKIESIDLSVSPIFRREHPKDKLGILDVFAKINNQEYCDIEMQMTDEDNIIERILYYWGKAFTKQLREGDEYKKLKKTIAILIANFKVKGLESLNYHSSWKIIEEKYRKTILTERLEIRIIELPKIANLQKEEAKLLDWLFFLENPNSERVIDKMKENEILQLAWKKLEEISGDEQMQQMAEWRYMGIVEENSRRRAKEEEEEKRKQAEEKCRQSEKKCKQSERKCKQAEKKYKQVEEKYRQTEEKYKQEEEKRKQEEDKRKQVEEKLKKVKQENEKTIEQIVSNLLNIGLDYETIQKTTKLPIEEIKKIDIRINK